MGVRTGEEFQKTGEVAFQFLAAERGQAAGAFGLGFGEAGVAEDFEVVGAGGFGDFEADFVAGEGAARGQQLADDGEAAGIGEGLQDSVQGDLAEGGMGIRFHRGEDDMGREVRQ